MLEKLGTHWITSVVDLPRAGIHHQDLEPVPLHRNNRLKLQEKGGSGQNSALGFNMRSYPMQVLPPK